jgi:hypothetical protein
MFGFPHRGNDNTPVMDQDPFEDAKNDPHSMGNLAIEKGYITEEDLREALKVQKERLKLGDILVEMGKLTFSQRDELLMEQSILRGEVSDKKILLKYETTRKRNRLEQMKQKFSEARGDAKEVTASITATMLELKANGG